MMKQLKKMITILLGISLLVTACDPFDDDSLSSEEILETQMPFVQYIISYWRGIDTGRFQLQWSQQLSGVSGRHLAIDRYQMERFDTENIWYFYYDHIYRDLQNIIAVSTEINARAYRGIARILQAYSLGFMTDTWGDVPHEMAMGYFSQVNLVTYDEQQNVYMEIMQLIEQGIQDLDAAPQGGGLMPGPEEDPIYQGNLDQWKKAANVIRLRHLLRMANQSGNYNIALGHITSQPMFAGLHDNMVYAYREDLDQVNPHYFFREVTRAGAFFVNMLLQNNDPRIPHLLSKNVYGEYVGTHPGSAMHNASSPGPAVASRATPLALITYTEQKFIEAEVFYKSGQHALADAAFEEAVISSLRSFDIEDPAWEAEHASVENVDLERIINAKYVALFLNPEVWSDYRRTGFPNLEGFNGEEIPRRFLYAEREYNINSANVPPDVDMYTRMWWDSE